MRSAIYLYGLARAGAAVPHRPAGIDEAAVRAVNIGRLAAIVAEISPEPFESDAATDPGWLIPRALQHDAVIEAIRQATPSVMPVRFGSLFSTRRALDDWCAANQDAIDDYLDRVADKDEWTIRLGLDTARVTEDLAAVDPEWSTRMRALPDSAGARYLRKKRLDDDALREARRRSLQAAGRARAAALALADERVLVPRKSETPGVEPVFAAAYLVPRGEAASFCERVRDAASGLPFLQLETRGPWAAARFCPALTAPER